MSLINYADLSQSILHLSVVTRGDVIAVTGQAKGRRRTDRPILLQLLSSKLETVTEHGVSINLRNGPSIALSLDAPGRPSGSGAFCICTRGSFEVAFRQRWDSHEVVLFDGNLREVARYPSHPDFGIHLPNIRASGICDIAFRDCAVLSSSSIVSAEAVLLNRFAIAAAVGFWDAIHFAVDQETDELRFRVVVRRAPARTAEQHRYRVECEPLQADAFAKFSFNVCCNPRLPSDGLADLYGALCFACWDRWLFVALDFRESEGAKKNAKKKAQVRCLRLPRPGRRKKTLWTRTLPLTCSELLEWRVKLLASSSKLCVLLWPREKRIGLDPKCLFLWAADGAPASPVLELTGESKCNVF